MLLDDNFLITDKTPGNRSAILKIALMAVLGCFALLVLLVLQANAHASISHSTQFDTAPRAHHTNEFQPIRYRSLHIPNLHLNAVLNHFAMR